MRWFNEVAKLMEVLDGLPKDHPIRNDPAWSAYGLGTAIVGKTPPSREAVARRDQCLQTWLWKLAEDARLIVWHRANRDLRNRMVDPNGSYVIVMSSLLMALCHGCRKQRRDHIHSSAIIYEHGGYSIRRAIQNHTVISMT